MLDTGPGCGVSALVVFKWEEQPTFGGLDGADCRPLLPVCHLGGRYGRFRGFNR